MNKKRILSIDIIKCISATLIVFHHYQQVFNCRFDGINFFGGKFYYGNIVELFFIISGFLSAYSFKSTTSFSFINTCKELLRKLKRLYIMSDSSILISYILEIINSLQLKDNNLNKLLNYKSIIANFGLLFVGYPYFNMVGVNNPLWYVCILIQCYLLFYISSWLIHKYKLNSFVIYFIFTAVSLYLYYYTSIPIKITLRGISSFNIGLLLFYIRRYINSGLKKKKITIMCLILSLLSLSMLFYVPKHRPILQLVTYPSLILGFSNIKIKEGLINCHIGDISFLVYIWHCPLMLLFKIIGYHFNFTLHHSYFTMFLFTILIWIMSFNMFQHIIYPIKENIKANKIF